MVFKYFKKQVAESQPSIAATVVVVDNDQKGIHGIPVKGAANNAPPVAADGSDAPWTDFSLFNSLYKKTYGAGNGVTDSSEWKLVSLDTCPYCGGCHSSSTTHRNIDLDEASSKRIGTSKCFSRTTRLKETNVVTTTDDLTLSDDVIMGDQDMWIEQSFTCKVSGVIQYYYYHSMKTGRNVRGSPPTDASIVIYELDLPTCHPIIKLYVKQLPRLHKKIILEMRKIENDNIRNYIRKQQLNGRAKLNNNTTNNKKQTSKYPEQRKK